MATLATSPSVRLSLTRAALAMAAAHAAVFGMMILTIAEVLARPRAAIHLLLAGGSARRIRRVESAGIKTLSDGGLFGARLFEMAHLRRAEAARVRRRSTRCACDGAPSRPVISSTSLFFSESKILNYLYALFTFSCRVAAYS